MAEAIRDLNGVKLIIAGSNYDPELLDRITNSASVEYVGLLRPKEALALEARADVMIILYDPRVPINNFAMPNKLFEAMMFGVPVITNVAPEVVNEERCGIMVNYNDIGQIREAIVRLRDNKGLRRELGENGRKAFLREYNWTRMEYELDKAYDNLLGSVIPATDIPDKLPRSRGM